MTSPGTPSSRASAASALRQVPCRRSIRRKSRHGGRAGSMRTNALRWALTRRIVDTLGIKSGLAAAMTTGHDAFIPKDQVSDLRAAGLAHIISISGLHMAIVGGFVFAIARFAIAAWPWLALRISGKKLAAGLALASVLAYLILSGKPPPAERSAVTAAVAFGAILVDRQATGACTPCARRPGGAGPQPEAAPSQPRCPSPPPPPSSPCRGLAPPGVREINTPWPIRILQGVWTRPWPARRRASRHGDRPLPCRTSTGVHMETDLQHGDRTNLRLPDDAGTAIGAVLAPFGLSKWPPKVAGFAIDLINIVATPPPTHPTRRSTSPAAQRGPCRPRSWASCSARGRDACAGLAYPWRWR